MKYWRNWWHLLTFTLRWFGIPIPFDSRLNLVADSDHPLNTGHLNIRRIKSYYSNDYFIQMSHIQIHTVFVKIIEVVKMGEWYLFEGTALHNICWLSFCSTNKSRSKRRIQNANLQLGTNLQERQKLSNYMLLFRTLLATLLWLGRVSVPLEK